MAEGDTWTNSIIGAVITLLATPLLPFAPLFGGLVAGYLEGTDREAGLTVGALSGAIAFVPLLLVLIFLGNIFFLVLAAGFPGVPTVVGGLGIVVVLFAFLFGVVYVVFLSALGGWLGSIVKTETDIGPT